MHLSAREKKMFWGKILNEKSGKTHQTINADMNDSSLFFMSSLYFYVVLEF